MEADGLLSSLEAADIDIHRSRQSSVARFSSLPQHDDDDNDDDNEHDDNNVDNDQEQGEPWRGEQQQPGSTRQRPREEKSGEG